MFIFFILATLLGISLLLCFRNLYTNNTCLQPTAPYRQHTSFMLLLFYISHAFIYHIKMSIFIILNHLLLFMELLPCPSHSAGTPAEPGSDVQRLLCDSLSSGPPPHQKLVDGLWSTVTSPACPATSQRPGRPH